MEQGIIKDNRRLTTLIKYSEYRLRKRRESCKIFLNPNVADPHRGKAYQSALDVAAHRRGQDEAYLTVGEMLSGASTAADGVLWCERSGSGRFGFATLGLTYNS